MRGFFVYADSTSAAAEISRIQSMLLRVDCSFIRNTRTLIRIQSQELLRRARESVVRQVIKTAFDDFNVEFDQSPLLPAKSVDLIVEHLPFNEIALIQFQINAGIVCCNVIQGDDIQIGIEQCERTCGVRFREGSERIADFDTGTEIQRMVCAAAELYLVRVIVVANKISVVRAIPPRWRVAGQGVTGFFGAVGCSDVALAELVVFAERMFVEEYDVSIIEFDFCQKRSAIGNTHGFVLVWLGLSSVLHRQYAIH